MFKLLLVAALVVQAAVPAPAAARKPDRWVENPACTAASLDTTNIEVEEPIEGYVLVWIDGELNCGGGRAYMFGVSAFAPGDSVSYVYSPMFRGYDQVAPTTFRLSVPVMFGSDLGICAHPGPRTTLACVRISAASLDSVIVTDLPRDLWPRLIVETPVDNHTQPQCNNCWNNGG